MSENPIPAVGQMWRDNDTRSKGSGEFTIEKLFKTERGVPYARVRREATGKLSRIKVSRLATLGSRGYTYIGMKR